MDPEFVILHTRRWIQSVVMGLNLCPFAHKVFQEARIHYAVSAAPSLEALLEDFGVECLRLIRTPVEQIETIFLIHPYVLTDFEAYNQFLEMLDVTVEKMGWEGIIQVASFHPDYQFADTDQGDVENYTNRSPYPMLHLLREESLAQALTHYPNPEQIPERNVREMRRIGIKRMQEMWRNCFNI